MLFFEQVLCLILSGGGLGKSTIAEPFQGVILANRQGLSSPACKASGACERQYRCSACDYQHLEVMYIRCMAWSNSVNTDVCFDDMMSFTGLGVQTRMRERERESFTTSIGPARPIAATGNQMRELSQAHARIHHYVWGAGHTSGQAPHEQTRNV